MRPSGRKAIQVPGNCKDKGPEAAHSWGVHGLERRPGHLGWSGHRRVKRTGGVLSLGPRRPPSGRSPLEVWRGRVQPQDVGGKSLFGGETERRQHESKQASRRPD